MKIEKHMNHNKQIMISPSALYMETDILDLEMPIAIGLTLAPTVQYAWWGDTSRGHTIQYTSYDITDDKIVIIDEKGRRWQFEPLTLSLFNQKAKHLLSPLDKPFMSDEEVQNYYAKVIFWP